MPNWRSILPQSSRELAGRRAAAGYSALLIAMRLVTGPPALGPASKDGRGKAVPSRLALSGQMIDARSRSEPLAPQLAQDIEDRICQIVGRCRRTPLIVDDANMSRVSASRSIVFTKLCAIGTVDPRGPKHERGGTSVTNGHFAFELRAAIDAEREQLHLLQCRATIFGRQTRSPWKSGSMARPAFVLPRRNAPPHRD